MVDAIRLSVRSGIFHQPFFTDSLEAKSEKGIFLEGPSITNQPVVALENTFYIFGGKIGDGGTKTIAAFSTITKQWKKSGELHYARYGHGVFIQKGTFIVIGGLDIKTAELERKTERCTLIDESIQCTAIDPKLNSYFNYPEMIYVSDDYCQ